MNKLFLIDAGHGGISPSGKYVTAGKRSPKFDDGSVLYEGVNNRKIASLLVNKLKRKGLNAINLETTYHDTPLSERVKSINHWSSANECVLISIHSDAFGNGSEWTSPHGFTVFNSRGNTKSDVYSEVMLKHLTMDVPLRSRGIKESNFYILKNTSCPAMLLELGFHSNKKECEYIMSNEWHELATNSIVEACKEINHL